MTLIQLDFCVKEMNTAIPQHEFYMFADSTNEQKPLYAAKTFFVADVQKSQITVSDKSFSFVAEGIPSIFGASTPQAMKSKKNICE